ncbi:MAG: thiamine diphosphokinase [Bacillota bacterium]|nr:thiamine diphosphokinase [Bacillota bacterium]
MENRVIIFANGSYDEYDFYLKQIRKEDYIICADGGTNYAFDMGLTPHLVIGDMDSVEKNLLKELDDSRIKIRKYPSEKDESDLELAINYAIGMKPKEILIFGALGKRVDHLFANITLLMLPLKHGIRTMLVDQAHEVYVASAELTIAGEPGDYVSLFPLTEEVIGVTTTGLKYVLNNAPLFAGASRGLSNELTGSAAKITLIRGYLLVIKVSKAKTK